MRGLLREYGVTIPNGAAKVCAAAQATLEDAGNDVPMALRATLADQLDRIATLQTDMAAIERRLAQEAEANKLARRLWALDHYGTAFNPNHTSHKPA